MYGRLWLPTSSSCRGLGASGPSWSHCPAAARELWQFTECQSGWREASWCWTPAGWHSIVCISVAFKVECPKNTLAPLEGKELADSKNGLEVYIWWRIDGVIKVWKRCKIVTEQQQEQQQQQQEYIAQYYNWFCMFLCIFLFYLICIISLYYVLLNIYKFGN